MFKIRSFNVLKDSKIRILPAPISVSVSYRYTSRLNFKIHAEIRELKELTSKIIIKYDEN